MGERVQRCQQWIEQAVEHMKSSTMFDKASSNPKLAFYGAAILAALGWLLMRATKLLEKPQKSRQTTPDLEKPAARSFKTPQRKPGGTLPTLATLKIC
jgi:hypothetical protein